MEDQYKNTPVTSTIITPELVGSGASIPVSANQQVSSPLLSTSPENSLEAPILPDTNSLEAPTETSQNPVTSLLTDENIPTAQPPRPKKPLNKAFIFISGSAVAIVLLVALGVGLLSKRHTTDLQPSATSVSEQGVALGTNTPDVLSVLQLKGSQDKLIVNGDIITTGRLSLASGGAYGQFVANNLTANREYILPDASGTLCLDSNNCNYLTSSDVTITSISGVSGAINLGAGLSIQGTTLVNSQTQTTLNSASGAITLQGTSNQISVSVSGNVVTLSTPQDIGTNSTPIFAGVSTTTLTVTGGNASLNGIAYTLPSLQGTGVLANDGLGGLTWVPVGGACPTCFLNNGNSFGTTATLGTNDNNTLVLETNGTGRLTIDTNGNVGISAASTGAKLYVPYQTGDIGVATSAGSLATSPNALVQVGDYNNTNNNLIAISGESYSGVGVQGASQTGVGVVGQSGGSGGPGAGVLGVNFQSGGIAVAGLGGLFGSGNGIGVAGYSDNAAGVFGQSSNNISGLFQSTCTGLFGCSVGPSSDPTLVARQYGSATADLFQAQDSAEAPLFSVGYNGDLHTVGDATIDSQLAVGGVASVTSNTVATFQELYTANSGSLSGTNSTITLAPVSASSANASAATNNIAISGQNHSGFLIGSSNSVTNNGTGTIDYAFGTTGGAVNTGNGNIAVGYGSSGVAVNSGSGNFTFLGAGVVGQIQNTGSGNIVSAASLFAAGAVNSGGGSITSNTGLFVQAQTAGVSDYGIQVEAADTQTLWLSSNANNTTASAGIAFGSSRDTNLYRSAADTLKTDDNFVVQNTSSDTLRVNRGDGVSIFSVTTSGIIPGVALGDDNAAVRGTLVFNDLTAANAFGGAILGANEFTSNRLIYLPDADGTICLQNSASCGFALSSGSGNYINNTTTAQTNANIAIQSGAIGNITATLKAFAGQTADLLQVQDSSGNSLGGLAANGGLYLGRPSGASGSLTFYNSGGSGYIALSAANPGSNNYGITIPNASGTICLTSGNCAGVGGTGDILNNGNSFGAAVVLGSNDSNLLQFETGGTTYATLDTSGRFGLNTTAFGTNNRLLVNPYNTVDNLATAQISTTAATNKGLVVQGFASQSANLFEAQSSTGAVVASISPAGATTLGASSSGAGTLTINAAGGSSPFIIKDTANSNQTVAGIFITGDQGVLALGTNVTDYNNGLTRVSGVSGQSSYFNNGGAVGIGTTTVAGTVQKLGVNTYTTVDNAAASILSSGGAANKALVVQGAASQSANLQEWQNSSGGALVAVDASGRLGVGSTSSIPGRLTVAGSADENQFILRTHSTQTSDILKIQNSTGSTTYIQVNSAGQLQFGSATANATTPSLTGSASSGTGIYFAATGQVNFATTGAERLRVAMDTTNTDLLAQSGNHLRLGTSGSGVSCTISNTNGSLSCPGAGSNSERFGSGSTAAGATAVAVGRNAAAAAQDSVAIGSGATIATAGSGQHAIAIGASSTADEMSIAIGRGASASSGANSDSIAIGFSASANFDGSIALGWGATTTAGNQLVIGSNAAGNGVPITSTYIGSGVVSATPSSTSINATGSSSAGTAGAALTMQGGNAVSVLNTVGGALNLNGGQGTGTAVGGSINFSVAKAGGGSSSANNGLSVVASLSGTSGAATFQNSLNSSAAFRILDTSSNVLFNADTSNNGKFSFVTADGGSSSSATLTINNNDVTGGNQGVGLRIQNASTGNAIEVKDPTGASNVFSVAGSGNSVFNLPDGYGNGGTYVLTVQNSDVTDGNQGNGLLIQAGGSGSLPLRVVNRPGTSELFAVNGTGQVGLGTTTFGANNKLLVNPYNTVDNAATAQISTTAATNKGLVVQGFTSQSANLQEWQNSSGTVLSSVTSNGYLRVGNGGTATGQLYVAGQIPTTHVGSHASVGAYDMAARNNVMFVLSSTPVLRALDISNPASPAQIGTVAINTPGQTNRIVIQGRYAYVTSGTSRTMQIVDISNPASMSVVGTVSWPSGWNTAGLAVNGNYAYVANPGNATLSVVDVSVPTNPAKVAQMSTNSGLIDAYIQGKYLYITDTNLLRIYDISNPASPSLAGSVATTTSGNIRTYVQGRYAYILSGDNIQIFDVSNPASPSSVSVTATGGGATGLAIQGRNAYVTNQTPDTLQVFDISSATAPASIGTITTTSFGGNDPFTVYAYGRYAYVINGGGGGNLGVFDMGGTYSQQVEAGTVNTGSLSVSNSAFFGAGVNIQNSATVGGGLQVTGNSKFITTPANAAFSIQNTSNNSIMSVNTLTSGLNLIANPSFEQSMNGWSAKGAATITNDDTAANANFGNRTLKIATTAAANDGASYRFPFVASTQYSFSFWAKLDSGSATTINFGRADNGSDTDCITGQTVNTTWTQFTCTFTTGATIGASANLYIKQSDASARNIFIDGITLVTGSLSSTYQAPAQNLQVDAYYNNLSLNGQGSGETQNWQASSNALPANRYLHGSVVGGNGYAYVVGGHDGSTQTSTVYYAKLNTDGSTGAWSTNGYALGCATAGCASPKIIEGAGVTTYNGYIYVIGGFDGSTNLTSTYYAKLNSDGSTGPWILSGNATPGGRRGTVAVTANGYVYIFGGNTTQTAVYYAKLNSDGSIGAWNVNANNLANSRQYSSAIVANGYVYVIGGAQAGASTATVYYGRLNADGTVGAFTTTASNIPLARQKQSAVVVNGYLYVIAGGSNATTGTSTVYFSKLNNDGSLGAFQTSANTLPSSRLGQTSVTANGYIYSFGGSSNGGANANNDVLYTSTSRILVGGSLDLVGLSNSNLADSNGDASLGSVGGSLTAGNTRIVGSLDVQGPSSFAQSVTIQKNLNVRGGLNVQSNSINRIGTAACGVSGCGSSLSNIADTFVQGRYMYTVRDSGSDLLTITDISNPASPVWISNTSTADNPRHVIVSGRYAYVASATGQVLQVFDVSNPTTPVQVGSNLSLTNGPSSNGTMYLSGKYLYILESGQIMDIVDISNPASLSFAKANYSIGTTNGRDVFVQGRYAYTVHSTSPLTLVITDVSDPANPSSAGSVTAGGSNNGGALSQVYVSGRYAYVTGDSGSNNMYIFDVSNPTSPTLKGTAPLGARGGFITVQGRYAYVGGSQNTGYMWAVDITDASNPFVAAQSPETLAGGISGGMFVQGRYVYAGMPGVSQTDIYDLGSAYVQQLEVGGIETSTFASTGDAVVGNNLNVSGGLIVGTGISAQGSSSFNGGGENTTALAVTNRSTSTTAGSLQGQSITLTDTGVVTTGTDNTTGQGISVTRTGATGGTINATGLSASATGDNAGAGTSNTYGLYGLASGGDNVYGVYGSGVTSTGSGNAYGGYFAATGLGTTTTNVVGVSANPIVLAASTVTTEAAFRASVTVCSTSFCGSPTVTSAYGLLVDSAVDTGGGATGTVIGSNYGVRVSAQTLGAADYGIAIDATDTTAGNATLWVSSNTDSTGATGGITFGSSKDTNLYRSAADTLTTDDNFTITGSNSITMGTTPGTTGRIRLPNATNIGWRNAGNTGNLTAGFNGSDAFAVLSTVANGSTVAQFNNAGAETCTISPGAGTQFACSSDARLKTNVVSIGNGLDLIKQLRGVNFNWIDDPNQKDQSGFIAQELMQILPEAVSQDSNGYYVANYTAIIPYLVGAAQQQDIQITGLQTSQTATNNNLSSTNTSVNSLEQRVAALEAGQPQGNNSNFVDLNVSGAATVNNLTVTGAATIAQLTVTGDAHIKGNLLVDGHVIGNQDTRGEVVIPAGQTEIKTTFKTPYGKKPYVVASPVDKPILFSVKTTKDDFTIIILNPEPGDTAFNFMVQE